MPRTQFKTNPLAHPNSIVGGTDQLKYRFTVLDEGLLRFEHAADGKFEDRASTLAINRHRSTCPKFRVIQDEKHLEIITRRFHLYYDKQHFSPNGLTVQVLGGETAYESQWRYGGSVYGDRWNIGGTARTLDGVDGRIEVGEAVIQKNGYAMLDDTHSMLFTDDGWVCGRNPGDRIDGYLFCYGHEYREAIKAFYELSGPQPLLPRWALGNWWSRYWKYTDQEYIGLMDRFRDEGVPLSVGVIDMDWHLVEEQKVKESGFSGWTGYSWSPQYFPKPKEFLAEMHKRDLKVTPNDHPADGVAPYEDMYQEMCKRLGHDSKTGDPIAFDATDKNFIDAYFDILLKALEDDGIDFWWIDWQQGPFSAIPGVDPLWVLNHFHYLTNARHGKRPLTFSRFAGPGSHRYPVGFSGDSVVSWDSLNFQPEFTASASNIGYGWWSHDIGGHFGGYRSNELATRWVQYGVFSPILRLHSSCSAWDSKEPWKFPENYQKIMTNALRLRHRLVPYLYSMNVLSARSAQPLVQPLYWDHPTNDEAYHNKNCYLFGTQLLIAPITSPSDPVSLRGRVRAYLPAKKYVDVFSGIVYDGDRELWMYRTLDEYPVLAQPGAIIPLDGSAEPENGCKNPTSLEVLVVPGDNGQFLLVEDAGTGTLNEVKEVNTLISYKQAPTGMHFTVEAAVGDLSAIPMTRDWKITFIALASDTKFAVTVNSATREAQSTELPNGVSVTIKEVPVNQKINITTTVEPQLLVTDIKKHVHKIIHEAQTSYSAKQAAWEVLTAKSPMNCKMSKLDTLDLDDNFIMAIEEIILADSRNFA